MGGEWSANRQVSQSGQDAGPFLEREPLRVDGEVELGWRDAPVDAAVQREAAVDRVDVQPVELPPVAAARDPAGQRPYGELAGAPLPARAGEVERPGDRDVVEREFGVQLLEVRRHVRRPQGQRILDHDLCVDEPDGKDVDRAAGAALLVLPPLAPDQRAKIPTAISALRDDHPGPRQRDPADRRPLVDQFADAVVERHLVDADQRLAVLQQPDAAQRETAENRTLEAVDL
jgi:hypothetical protein